MDQRPHPLSNASARDTTDLLYGDDPTPGIVAVEQLGANRVRLYRRTGDGWSSSKTRRSRPGSLPSERNHGAQPAARRGWRHWRAIIRCAISSSFPTGRATSMPCAPPRMRASGSSACARRSSSTWCAVGRTLFKEMVFSDLRRLQIDIETTGFDPRDPDSQVIVVAIKIQRRHGGGPLAPERDEAELLERVTERLREFDPDVIEGHNLFNFDLPFMAARAERFGLALRWGRDGSPVRIGAGTARFKAGAADAAVHPGLRPRSPHHRHLSADPALRHWRSSLLVRAEAGGRGARSDAARIGSSFPGPRYRRGLAARPGSPAPLRARRRARRRDALRPGHADRVLSDAAPATVVPGGRHRRPGGEDQRPDAARLSHAWAQRPHRASHRGTTPAATPSCWTTGVFRPVVKCDVESLYPSIMLVEGDHLQPRHARRLSADARAS